jgi:hypothetical protein
MSHRPLYNRPAFDAAARYLRGLGYAVESPSEFCRGFESIYPAASLWRECMRVAIPRLLHCDAVAVLPQWDESRGARIEYLIARRMGMPVVWADGLAAVRHDPEWEVAL